MDQTNQNNNDQTSDSLEANSLESTPPDSGQLEGNAPVEQPNTPVQKPKKPGFKRIFQRFNIYLLIFLLLIGLAVALVIVLYINAKSSSKVTTIQSQSLSNDALKQLANSDATVGDPKQVLNVQSNAIFAGKVFIRQGTEIAGDVTIGGNVTIPSVTVNGSGTFDQLQSNSLSVSGNAAVQGQLSIQKSLSVNGSGTFSGGLTAQSISTGSLQLNGDLTFTRHFVTGGNQPAKSDGAALGAGGTSSISGSDTSGTVAINTGSGTAAGCFITATFANRFNATPHVQITPVGSTAAGIQYYINRSATSFSICTASPAPTATTFGFDYFVSG